jgi:hypothetical protein
MPILDGLADSSFHFPRDIELLLSTVDAGDQIERDVLLSVPAVASWLPARAGTTLQDSVQQRQLRDPLQQTRAGVTFLQAALVSSTHNKCS